MLRRKRFAGSHVHEVAVQVVLQVVSVQRCQREPAHTTSLHELSLKECTHVDTPVRQCGR